MRPAAYASGMETLPRFRLVSNGRLRPEPALVRIFAILALLAAGSLLAPVGTRAAPDDESPFTLRAHALPGTIEQVWPLAVSRCPGGESDLLVLQIDGEPPSPRRIVTWMPCGAALRPGDSGIIARELAPETVGIDVARVPGRSGPQLLLLSTRGLTIESWSPEPEAEASAPLVWRLPALLPLPPRPRSISRIPLVDDWHSTGRPMALVPALSGAFLLDMETGHASPLPLPIYADYETWEPSLPDPEWSWLAQEVYWPTLTRADDDGDGRLDLFALSRWSIWIYRAGAEGLPHQPTRRLALQPFDADTERRHEGTSQTALARDLDADGRADLLLTSVTGSLKRGRTRTRIHRGRPGGVDLDAPASALRETEGAFSSVHPVDLDGDGRVELIEMTVELGLVQLVRILLTRRAETRIRVLTLDAASSSGLRVVFEDDLAFRLDFGEGSVQGLIPSLGDWNGDGIQDLHVARDAKTIGFRLGSPSNAEDEPLFGSVVGHQGLPLRGGQSRSADLDGDGLDELIAFDRKDPDAPLVVLHNRGRLPGTASGLRPGPGRNSAPLADQP